MSDILTTLNNIGYTSLIDSGDFWRTKAIYRDGDNPTSLAIRKINGDYYDFVENKGGRFQDLILKTLQLPTGTDITSVIPNFIVPISVDHHIELYQTKTFDKTLLLKLNKDYTFFNQKGISNAILELLQSGVADQYRMKDRYVFGIFGENGDLVGFAGRLLFESNIYVKWKLLGQKKEWVYPAFFNAKECREKKTVYLVESIGNMLSLWEIGVKNVIVLFGCKISAAITTFLIKNDIQKIILLLDNDSNNGFAGNNNSLEIERFLGNHFDSNQIINRTDELKYKDCNEWLVEDRQGFEEFIKTKTIV